MTANQISRGGPYQLRFAQSAGDIVLCQQLRHRCFLGADGLDADVFDAAWDHLMVMSGEAVIATVRLSLGPSALADQGYAAGFYDLSRLCRAGGQVLEIGRFCSDPAYWDPMIPRVVWGALTRIVDAENVGLVFGCTSFAGVDPQPYAEVFQRLALRHAAPDHLAPARRSKVAVPLTMGACTGLQSPMPPLLRTYVAMGGWVSDHAVIDPEMNTLHVFTGLEVAKVPPARAKVLRALV